MSDMIKEKRSRSTRGSTRNQSNIDYDDYDDRREPTRKEIKQAKRVRKKEAKIEKLKAKQLQKFRDNKGDVRDFVFVEKESVWLKVLPGNTRRMFAEMGDTPKAIEGFQQKRFITSVGLVLAASIFGYLIHPIAYVVGIGAGIFFYVNKGASVGRFYRGWKFERHLAFSKFTRLVIPYLKSSGGNMALYTIFSKILQRMENSEDRRSLYQLMGEMGDRPTDIQPFLDFADRSSGTDMSHLFMSTIFDFQQSTFDVSVIDELGKMASEDMMNSIDEIIAFKLKRFGMFPTKIVMSSFILVAGLAVGMLLHSVQALDFSSGGKIDIQEESRIEIQDDSARLHDDYIQFKI